MSRSATLTSYPLCDDPDALTLRQVAELWGHSLRVVRSWRERWPDWPEPAGCRLVLAGRNTRHTRALVYEASRMERCIAAHRQLPAEAKGLWSIRQAAAELSLTEDMVRDARRRGALPEPAGFVDRVPRWRPADLRWWAANDLVPGEAWTATQVEAHAGLTADECVQRGLAPDGRARGGIRWWRPERVRSWRAELQSAEAQAAADQAKARSDAAQSQIASSDTAGTAESSPKPRWSMRDVAAATGLSYMTTRTYRSKGRLPPPDGTSRSGSPWWSPETIRGWDRPATTGRPRRSNTST